MVHGGKQKSYMFWESEGGGCEKKKTPLAEKKKGGGETKKKTYATIIAIISRARGGDDEGARGEKNKKVTYAKGENKKVTWSGRG